MLTICDFDANNYYRYLECRPDIFHKAIYYVLRGEYRFHVGENAENGFDLVYADNDAYTKQDSLFPDSDFYKSEIFFPPYHFYNENDIKKINLELFDGFEEIFFEEVNEYSIVIADIVNKHTKLKVSFKNEKYKLFPWIAEFASYSSAPTSENSIFVQHDFNSGYTLRNRYCTIGLFHSLFLLQWISDLPFEQIKYISLAIRKTEGIGSIMGTWSCVYQAFKKKGIKTYIEPGSYRFDQEFLNQYFIIGKVPEDASENNTAYAKCFNSFVLNQFVQTNVPRISLHLLVPEFLAHLQEYADSIIADKKVLGVLLRGSDYIVANFAGSYHTPSIEICLDYIRKKFAEGSYEKIFVASEDSDYIDIMLNNFPGKVVVVAQERFKAKDVENVKYISEYEKKKYHGSDYDKAVIDNTINYFYAIYLLSRCESLISNCMCSGVAMARSFNGGKYGSIDIISQLIDEGKIRIADQSSE